MKILIVEDSKAMRMIVTRTLRQAGLGDHTVLEAENGAQGLLVCATESPDLVLCDWNMPEISGIELLRRLRAGGNGVPLGFVTSESSDATRELAAAAGAAFLIAKPFTVETFADVLGPVLV